MTTVSRTRGTADRLLEREDLLAALHGAHSEAKAGAGRLVLVAGEAGIGKTALAARPPPRPCAWACSKPANRKSEREERVMGEVKGFANVVFPARDLDAGVAAWTAMLGREPAFVGEDFAVFSGDGVEVGLTALPWVDHPLVFWKVDDIEDSQRALVARGATALGEVADGSLAELGTAEVTNGDPATGIVDVPGGRLAVLRAPDGNLIGLTQEG